MFLFILPSEKHEMNEKNKINKKYVVYSIPIKPETNITCNSMISAIKVQPNINFGWKNKSGFDEILYDI